MPTYIKFQKKKNTIFFKNNLQSVTISLKKPNIHYWLLQNCFYKNNFYKNNSFISNTVYYNLQYINLFNKLKIPTNFLNMLGLAYYHIVWFYSFSFFETWVNLFFSRFTLKIFPKYINILKIFSINCSLNSNLLGLSIKCKGKFSGYGNARKKKIHINKLPNYKPISPKNHTPIHYNIKTHFMLIFTSTGITSTLFIIKHIH